MNVTAAKIGSAPLTLDWSNMARVPTGKGPTSAAYKSDPAELSRAWETLRARFTSGEVGFYNSVIEESSSQAEASVALARELRESGRFTDCLFLGIGGSSLGPLSLLSALRTKTSDIRFHFVENPDADDWRHTLHPLRPDSTLVVSVTKSGTTFETLSQTLLALEWLGKERWKTHFVGVTDPTKGDLRAFCTEQGLRTLPIAPSIGGRFSVFCPVGLFPAALAGLSVPDFLAGARSVRDYCEKTPPDRNAFFFVGGALAAHKGQRPVHVCMPYSTLLRQIGAWWVQLWGESLGKDGLGFTPVAAVGATDQHSILQLLRDGPDDKVTLFLTIESVEDPVKIPRIPVAGALNAGQFALLSGHSLAELLEAEYRATARVLTGRQRPNLTLKIDHRDERCVGALMYAFCVMTAFTGTLMGVNPFDQPGVEEGKVYIRQSLSRDGESLVH